MKIVNKNPATFGQTIRIPVDGKVQIGKDGSVEVSDEAAAILIQSGGGAWVDPNAEEDDEEEEVVAPKKKKAAKAAAEEEGMSKEEFSALLQALNTMGVDDMLEVAKAAGIKAAARFKAKPEVLRNFIINKLKEANQ